ncbi:MAG: GNAT family N-acetyltransferase [Clostridia bacterium]|nr:GNAT family N-acetyltransferase [Lachnospiraceae bacterium]MCI9626956.1 GNAT family N-acetyltransferase [Clostridia bacterium]
MKLIKCEIEQLDAVSAMYTRVVKHLEETINYPKWSKNYPSRESVKEAIKKGEQYACVENGRVLGAVVLNDNPNGNYAAGDWTKDLKQGEYLVIHTLAVDSLAEHKGIGGYIVECCIEIAMCEGYQAIRIDVVPDNIPAINLYKRKGFTFAGTKDLLRDIDDIPLFELYELNFASSSIS